MYALTQTETKSSTGVLKSRNIYLGNKGEENVDYSLSFNSDGNPISRSNYTYGTHTAANASDQYALTLVTTTKIDATTGLDLYV